MHTEYSIVDYGSQTDEIKYIAAEIPYISCSVFTNTFIIKSIDLSNLSRLMVASYKSDSIGISHLG